MTVDCQVNCVSDLWQAVRLDAACVVIDGRQCIRAGRSKIDRLGAAGINGTLDRRDQGTRIAGDRRRG